MKKTFGQLIKEDRNEFLVYAIIFTISIILLITASGEGFLYTYIAPHTEVEQHWFMGQELKGDNLYVTLENNEVIVFKNYNKTFNIEYNKSISVTYAVQVTGEKTPIHIIENEDLLHVDKKLIIGDVVYQTHAGEYAL